MSKYSSIFSPPLESFKDNDIKREIFNFLEKRNDPSYPKNLVIEHHTRIGVRTLCFCLIRYFNFSFNRFNSGSDSFSRIYFAREHYNNDAHINVFHSQAIGLYKPKLLENILNRKDFLIKPLYEKYRIIKISNQINIFLCDFRPFLYKLKDEKVIQFVNEKCKFIKIDRKIGKLYIE
ncbi:MAG: threonine synthase [Candidatus Phytoplasma stylosanthis]|nr:threonine synthase [Candidatus Phytoplasma stylosanthis]